MKASYDIVASDAKSITIRDIGPWDRFASVTNAAEEVLAELDPGRRRVFYYDSENEPGELLHENGRFTGFAPWNPLTP